MRGVAHLRGITIAVAVNGRYHLRPLGLTEVDCEVEQVQELC
jgi:hypothetical protein